MFNSIFVTGSLTWSNVLLVLGLALLLGFSESLYYTRKNLTATRSFAFTLALLAMCGLILPMLVRKKGSRVQGAILVLGYIGYCVWSFVSAGA